MLRALYDWVLRLSAHRRAPAALAGVSFAESSFFPIPPDAMLIPMCLAKPERAYYYALVCTIASVAGGVLGYVIGYYLFEAVAMPVLRAYGYTDALARFEAWYGEWGAWLILIKGLTPIPYKIVTIASGAAKFSFLIFMVCSVITRGARFFLVAALIRRYGAPIQEFIERRLTMVTTVAAVLIVLGFVALRYL